MLCWRFYHIINNTLSTYVLLEFKHVLEVSPYPKTHFQIHILLEIEQVVLDIFTMHNTLSVSLLCCVRAQTCCFGGFTIHNILSNNMLCCLPYATYLQHIVYVFKC